jgi:hypothetical protein
MWWEGITQSVLTNHDMVKVFEGICGSKSICRLGWNNFWQVRGYMHAECFISQKHMSFSKSQNKTGVEKHCFDSLAATYKYMLPITNRYHPARDCNMFHKVQ